MFTAHWQLAGDGSGDLVIVETVSNTGPATVSLTAYAAAPGQAQQRHVLPGLQPGQSTTRSFRLPAGTMAGRSVRVGVIDEDGARVNRVLEIPGGLVAGG